MASFNSGGSYVIHQFTRFIHSEEVVQNDFDGDDPDNVCGYCNDAFDDAFGDDDYF